MDLPPILSDFADELAGQGFVVTNARYDAQAYGNGLVEFAAGPVSISGSCDRGQWLIEIQARR